MAMKKYLAVAPTVAGLLSMRAPGGGEDWMRRVDS
jgi:hypothetical protein